MLLLYLLCLLLLMNQEENNIISERLNIAKEEIKYKDKYDYIVINNTVDEAVLEIENIINNCQFINRYCG